MARPRYRAGKRLWTKADDRLMRKLYPDTPTRELAARLGRTVIATYQRARHVLGIKKSQAYLDSPAACRLRRGDRVGKAFRYPKGHVPANKGTRRPGYAVGRMRETQFKKGAWNWHQKRLGETRLVDGYVYVKVAEVPRVPWTVNWKPVHVIEWERANGRALDVTREALSFKDGNRLNVDLSNLELITRRQLMARNTVHNLPKPLAQTIQALGALRRQIRKRSA